ncbi:alpha-hydroxy-acid oxidizing protein [Rhizobium sp. BK602]|uniref:alpha-hydroxy-acid oxidizing protein n=1 Tax=Rhizobium sp. BK602 TaxID=2586986 RepID=UPI00161481CA|nr:alpha-hydroxy-acid oxidizing protein [Rhizobium sp. BK602]MBB3613016.1 lactate 2-monooxygenase [Rhizobium sp. BK602]
MSQNFGDFQNEIYLAGLSGKMPLLPVDFATLEEQAKQAMSPSVWSYVAGGCGDEFTQRNNAEAFNRYGIVPRMFNGAAKRDLSVSLFGRTLSAPVFLCPIGVVGLCSSDNHGDLRVAEAAAKTGVPMMASTLSQDPMEEVAKKLDGTPSYFQLYTPKDRDLALSFISRAENAGFEALVVTLDTWVTGWRPRDLNSANFPQLRGLCLANYFSDPHFLKRLKKPVAEDPAAAIHEWVNIFGHIMTWDDLKWMREATRLPIVLKGICHPDDARRAADAGIDAIQCSNHGGRQANGGIAALSMLKDVIFAVPDMPVLFDSGVRSGTDVAKALAMGAAAVGIGRSHAYALAAGGTEGVIHHLRSILAETDLLMAVNGYPTIADLRSAGVRQTR